MDRSPSSLRQYFTLIAVSLLVFCMTASVHAQDNAHFVPDEVIKQDRLFWQAYNGCKPEDMRGFFTDDVEFYHDKGGITKGAPELVALIKKNLCSAPSYHLRREEVSNTVKAFLLTKDNVVYGAVLYGEHYFYVTQDGKKEYRDGLARYFDIWKLENNRWKMSRIVSYDHKPAP